jgi:hypothetical protein
MSGLQIRVIGFRIPSKPDCGASCAVAKLSADLTNGNGLLESNILAITGIIMNCHLNRLAMPPTIGESVEPSVLQEVSHTKQISQNAQCVAECLRLARIPILVLDLARRNRRGLI